VTRAGAAAPAAPLGARLAALAAAAAAAVTIAVRLPLAYRSFDLFGDEVIYTGLGRSVSSGGWPRNPEGPFFLHPPGFFYLEAGWARLLPRPADVVSAVYQMRTLNVLLAAVTAAVLVLLAARAAGWQAGAAAGLLFALDPFCVRQNDRVLLETATMLWVLLGYLVAAGLTGPSPPAGRRGGRRGPAVRLRGADQGPGGAADGAAAGGRGRGRLGPAAAVQPADGRDPGGRLRRVPGGGGADRPVRDPVGVQDRGRPAAARAAADHRLQQPDLAVPGRAPGGRGGGLLADLCRAGAGRARGAGRWRAAAAWALLALLAVLVCAGLAASIRWAAVPDNGYPRLRQYLAAHVPAGSAVISVDDSPPSTRGTTYWLLSDRYRVGRWVTPAARARTGARYLVVPWAEVNQRYSYLTPGQVRALIRGGRLLFSYRERTYGDLALYRLPWPPRPAR